MSKENNSCIGCKYEGTHLCVEPCLGCIDFDGYVPRFPNKGVKSGEQK